MIAERVFLSEEQMGYSKEDLDNLIKAARKAKSDKGLPTAKSNIYKTSAETHFRGLLQALGKMGREKDGTVKEVNATAKAELDTMFGEASVDAEALWNAASQVELVFRERTSGGRPKGSTKNGAVPAEA